MKKKILIVVLLFLCIPFVKAEEVTIHECEVSEEYLLWSKLDDEEKSKYNTPEYCVSNGIEDYELEIDNDKKNEVQTYPSKYISASSKVRNQSVTGTCWAFAASTVLDSYLLRQYDIEFESSPGHLNYMESQSFYDITYNSKGTIRNVNDGGNYSISSLYYMNRLGPVSESTFNTNTSVAMLPNINSKDVIGLKNVINVNNIEFDYRSKSGACTQKEENRIKSLIYKYGPTGASIYLNDTYLKNNSYIFKGNSLTNHSVTIVGWDDEYSRNNFYYKPNSNGAWIVQNSYGESWGNNGIFYVSYEDDRVCSNIFSIRSVDADNDDNKYIYTNTYSQFYASANATMNVFNKKNNNLSEYLSRVSFQMDKPGKYKVYYYPGNAKKDNASLSDMILIGSGKTNYSGWVSIFPTKNILISKNLSSYSIAVYQSNNHLPIVNNKETSYDINGNPYTVLRRDKYSKNMSYVYVGGKWYDLYNYCNNGHFKAPISTFTDNDYLRIKNYKVNYSNDDYFDITFDVKALANGKIDTIQLVKDDKVIVEKTDLGYNVSKDNTYSFSLRKEGLSNFKNGKYKIYVMSSNYLYRIQDINIKVIPIGEVVITNKKGIKLEVGETLQLNTRIAPTNFNSTSPALIYSTSNNSIASIDENGLVTAKRTGHVIVYAKSKNEKVSSYELDIVKPITELSINRTNLYMNVGDEQNIWFFTSPNDTTDNKSVTWTISDESKVSIEYIDNENIKVKALSSGRTVLTAITSNGITKNVNVLIKGLSIEPSSLNLELKNTYNLTGVIIDDQFHISNDVSWSILDSSVASIDSNGKLKAKKLGSTIVTATTLDNRSVNMNLNVTKIQASSFSINSISNKTYNGNYIKPSITVKYKNKTLIKDKNYTVSYINNKYPGLTTIKIKAKKSNLYEGVKVINFIIKPKITTISSISTSSNSITVKWKTQSNTNNYQLQYKLKGEKSWISVDLTSPSYKIKYLVQNKTYQVRVRTYINVNNKNYFGSWSKIKTIKCK